MHSILLASLYLSSPSLAAEPASYDPNLLVHVDTAWVLVDANAWLYAEPREDAPRYRATMLTAAPEYHPSPAVPLRQIARYGDFLRVRTVPQAANILADERVGPPDVVPRSWSQCYAAPPALAQLATDRWVRISDLLKMTTRPVRIDVADGSVIELEAGLAVSGHSGTYRVRSNHLTLVVPLPDDAVALSRDIDGSIPVHTGLIATTPLGSHRVHPVWNAQVRIDDGALSLRSAAHPDAAPATVLSDRCLRITPASPLSNVPRLAPQELRAASGWPVLVPFGTDVTNAQGDKLGQVAGSDYVLWARSTCSWSTTLGLCCDPLVGLEYADNVSQPVCFNADLPIRAVDRDLQAVVSERQAAMSARLGKLGDLNPKVTWTRPEIRGAITADHVDEALQAEQANLLYCYERTLARHKGVQGEVKLRVAIAPDARMRPPKVLDDGVQDDVLLNCVFRRFEAIMVPMQLGETASIVDFTLKFTTD